MINEDSGDESESEVGLSINRENVGTREQVREREREQEREQENERERARARDRDRTRESEREQEKDQARKEKGSHGHDFVELLLCTAQKKASALKSEARLRLFFSGMEAGEVITHEFCSTCFRLFQPNETFCPICPDRPLRYQGDESKQSDQRLKPFFLEFPIEKELVTKKRANLKPGKVEKLMFLSINKHLRIKKIIIKRRFSMIFFLFIFIYLFLFL